METITIYRAFLEDYRIASDYYSLDCPDADHIYDVATVELPAGYTICDTVSGPCLFDDRDQPCELCIGGVSGSAVLAVSAENQRFLRRVPRQDPPPVTIKQSRLDAGLTQQQLADASGVSVQQIRKIEGGEIDPANMTVRNVLAICDVLGIDPHDLI